jgi:hypothetical protein
MTKVAWVGNLKLLNKIDGRGRIQDPISLDEISTTQPGKSIVFNNYAFNTNTIYRLFKNVVDDNLNAINISSQDFEEFLVGVRDNGIYTYLRGYMKIWDYEDPEDPQRNILNPELKEALKKIYLYYDGGSALGADHTYNTRGIGGRETIEPPNYEIKDEATASMKKRKRKGNKTKKHKKKKHTKRKKKRKSKRKIKKSKMR